MGADKRKEVGKREKSQLGAEAFQQKRWFDQLTNQRKTERDCYEAVTEGGLRHSVEDFSKAVDKMLASDICQMGENGYKFFLENYTVRNTYDTIMKHFQI